VRLLGPADQKIRYILPGKGFTVDHQAAGRHFFVKIRVRRECLHL
jgi:hypothetical protein